MFLSLRELGYKGVNKDLPPYELEPNEFTTANNVRFWDGTISTHPSARQVTAAKFTATTFNAFLDRDGSPYYSYATSEAAAAGDGLNTTLFVNNGAGFVGADAGLDISASPNWTSEIFGETIIMNNQIDEPFVFKYGATDFTICDGWDTGETLNGFSCKAIRKYKNFLVAMNITEAGISNPNRLIWSDESSDNSVPSNWDYQSASSLSGDNTISSDDGEIIDGLELGDAFIVYCTNAIYEMRFIGAPYVMSFRRITNNGLMNIQSVAAFDNFHFVVGNKEIYIHDGQTVRHIADQRIKSSFFDSIYSVDSVQCVTVPLTKEVWVKYRDTSGSFTENITGFVEQASPLFYVDDISSISVGMTVTFNGTGSGDLDGVSFVVNNVSIGGSYFQITATITDYGSGGYVSAEPKSSSANKAMIWCYEYDTFTFVDLNDVDVMRYGYRPQAATTWSSVTQTWLSTSQSWSAFGSTDLTPTLYLQSSFNTAFTEIDLFLVEDSDSPIAERVGIDMDRLLTKPTNTVKMVKQMLPQLDGVGTVRFTLGCADNPTEPVTWLDSQVITIGEEYHVDLFATGRYLAWRIEGVTGRFRLSGFDLDVIEVGER